jgi:sugar phosphate isomerase/epimerase
MAQLGIMTTEFEADSLDGAFDALVDHGVTTAQLQLGSVFPDIPVIDSLVRGLDVTGSRLTETVADEINQKAETHGVTIAAIDGTYNMIHPDEARRSANLGHLVNLIHLAPRIGSTIVALCTGTRSDIMWDWNAANGLPDAWDDLIAQLRVATAAAEEAGVVLAFEPEHSNVADSALKSRLLIDEVGSPSLKVLFDPANIFHAGDLARMQDHLAEAFDLIGKDIALAHAKDLDHDGAAGGRAAGRGLLDYPFFLRGLQRSGFDGAIILHLMHELDGQGIDDAISFVRSSAPSGYLS